MHLHEAHGRSRVGSSRPKVILVVKKVLVAFILAALGVGAAAWLWPPLRDMAAFDRLEQQIGLSWNQLSTLVARVANSETAPLRPKIAAVAVRAGMGQSLFWLLQRIMPMCPSRSMRSAPSRR